MYIRSLKRFLQPLLTSDKLVLGFRLNNVMNYVAGVTYILPTEGLYNAIRNFCTWYKEEQENSTEWIQHAPEDWAITRAVAACNGYTLWQWDNAQNPSTWLLVPYNYNEVSTSSTVSPLTLARYSMYDFVNFGNRHEITQNSTPRKFAADCMKHYIDFDLYNEFTPKIHPLNG
jgi:hypothetical protein